MVALQTLPGREFTPEMQKVFEDLKQVTGKRVGGGRVQMNVVSVKDLAEVFVPGDSGFCKLLGKPWKGKLFGLESKFQEAGWPMPAKAVLIALIDKYAVDPVDYFIPLSPGTDDIEAGLKNPCFHQELAISGVPGDPDPAFVEAINTHGMFGIAEEFHNLGPSLELVLPVYTPGIWQRVEDTQKRNDEGKTPMNRDTLVLVITPYLELACPGNNMSVNKLNRVPADSLSVKALKAIDLAKQFLRMI